MSDDQKYESYYQQRKRKKKEQEKRAFLHQMFNTAPCLGCGIRMSFKQRRILPLCHTAYLRARRDAWRYEHREGCYEQLKKQGSLNLDPLGHWKLERDKEGQFEIKGLENRE